MENQTALQHEPIVYHQEKADAIRQTIMKLQDIYSPSEAAHREKEKLINLYREELERCYQAIEKALI